MQKHDFFDQKSSFFAQKQVFFALIINVKNEHSHDF